MRFKEEDGFSMILSEKVDLVVISIGDQDDGCEYYERLRNSKIPYVIVNRLTKEERFWPIRHAKQSAVKAGYLGAKKYSLLLQIIIELWSKGLDAV